MRVIDGKVPPGGWHFKQKLVSSPQRPSTQLLYGQTFSDLLENVFQFRLNNLEVIPSGTATRESVDSDVGYYICGHFPQNCTGAKSQFVEMARTGHMPGKPAKERPRPLSRIEDWITTLGEHELKFVDQMRAHERTRVCMKCPLNQAWRTGCGPCNDNAVRRASLIRGSHATGLEKKLNACTHFGTLLELAVWLEEDHAEGRSRHEPPDKCWKLTELHKAPAA